MPFLNCTVPVGVPAAVDTVAVLVTGEPKGTEAGDAVATVVVAFRVMLSVPSA